MAAGPPRAEIWVVSNSRARPETGSAVVELALTLPILVMILWGIIQFGLGFNAKVELASAVREGARTAALSTNSATVATDTRTAVRDAAPGLPPAAITVSLDTPCPTNPAATDKAEVSATYDFDYNIPPFFSGTWTLTARGSMRCGG